MTGYLHPLYSESLSEFGRPARLQESGGWLLERPIGTSGLKDAMGSYPLFCCPDWTRLDHDLGALGKRFVTVSLTADPFAPVTAKELAGCFQLVKPFKEHFVVDATQATERHVTKHHRYYARRALANIDVAMADAPSAHLDEWTQLYDELVRRHKLHGIKAFSRLSFAAQLRVPGLVMFRALHRDKVLGAHLWFLQGGIAYSHLAAFSPEGYALGAAYALYWRAIQTFKEGCAGQVQWIDLGAGAGVGEKAQDGLSQFKRGWASTVRMKYFCGRICDADAYRELCNENPRGADSYFPGYRSGELA